MSESKKIAVFKSSETFVGGIINDVVTFGFLMLCIWFSNDQGGGFWTFFTCCLFLIWLKEKAPGEWIKLKNKKEAIAWANSLSDDLEQTP